MSVNVGMSVDISGFTSGIREGQNVMKGLNAEMKAAEAEFKATGNAEQLTANKTRILTNQLNAQKGIVDQAKAALKAMTDAGITPADAAYQKLNVQMLNAQAGMNEAQAALNGLGASAQEAATGADQLTQSVNNIGKKISLEQVISGINKITDGLENAARKAVRLGETIWNSISDSGERADNIATMASILGMDIEDYQRYQKVFDTIADITVADWQRARQKVQSAVNNPSGTQKDVFDMLGISLTGWEQVAGQSGSSIVPKSWEKIFWDVGAKLREQVAKGMMSQDQADYYAQALFGKSWANLNPIFDLGEEGFAKALEEQFVTSEEAITRLAKMNDTIIKLKGDFQSLQDEVLSGLAPALTKAAEVLDGMLGKLMEYLQTPEGQQALEDMGKAVEGIFTDISKIDPQKVVKGFSEVFTNIVGGLEWLSENSGTVVGAMEAIVGGWAALKLTGGALQIANLINGITGLTGGGAAAAGRAGAAAGASWGSGFAAAVLKAAPWLAGLYTLLNPSGTSDQTGDNTLIDENGNLTKEATKYGYTLNENGEINTPWDSGDWKSQKEAVAQEAWDLWRKGQLTAEIWGDIKNRINDNAAFDALAGLFSKNSGKKGMEDLDLSEWLKDMEPVEVPVEPEVTEDAAEKLAAEIGVVQVPATLIFSGNGTGSRGGSVIGPTYKMKANGIWSVPYDGYLAALHQGERVVPAREVAASRNFSSNLYVESMYMNNGQDAEGLAAAMAAAQRRTMSGYGS